MYSEIFFNERLSAQPFCASLLTTRQHCLNQQLNHVVSSNLWSFKAEPDHFQEWLDSGVDPGIVRRNVETLTDTASDPNASSLFPIAERLNWTITRFGKQARANLRGWWVSGIDPFNNWQRMTWGRFKPDSATPVMDREKGKPAKYLSPSLGPGSSRLVLLDVPSRIWQKVAQRHNISIPLEEKPLGFWHWVWKYNLPITITEGEKKAGCLLTLGYAAIALPGIFNGYRRETRQLIPELAHFATLGRPVSICFDYEIKPKTIKDINLAITKLGKLLVRAGCKVRVISLPGPQKGVDDFVVSQGQQAFHALYEPAPDLEFWQASKPWLLTYTPSLVLNQRYLGELPFPEAGLVCIQSCKGSGKTAALEFLIRNAIRQGRKVVVLTHRTQLGRAICDRLGIDWIEEVRESETRGLFGFGLCVDSLHFKSQARFNPQDWKGAILLIDEAEQVIWHALNSSTCYEKRVKILETLRELVHVVLNTGGLVVAQDADLSDLSIDYLRGLAETPIEPWVVINQWQPEQGWTISYYDTSNPAPLLSRLETMVELGPVYVALDSQKVKGKWSSKNLETQLQRKFPDKRILRIDSETVANPQHPSYGIVEHLNEVITDYDIILATPTIGTGVSIDVRGHFIAVFGVFQGAIPDSEARQALARVRDTVPRFVWCARFGPGKIGNGSCSYRDVLFSTTKAIKYNIALLKEVDFDLDTSTDPITLRTWAKMAARVNSSMWNYREALRNALLMEGHQVTVITADLDQLLPPDIKELVQELSNIFSPEVVAADLQQDLTSGVLQFPGFEYLEWQHCQEVSERLHSEITAIRGANKQSEAIAVASAPDITSDDYEQLKAQRAKTPPERYAERKHELQHRYPIPITPELKLKDDEGWYPQIRLHYYLTHNPAFVQMRDRREWQGHLERGEGKIALQDVRLLTAQVEALRGLGILQLLDPERQVRANDADVQRLATSCKQHSHDIKAIFNLTVSEKMTPIEIVQTLLGKLGVKLTCIGRDQTLDGRRGGLRVYQYQPPTDGRDNIFVLWQYRDESVICPSPDPNLGVASPSSPAMYDPPLDIYS
ncbi:MAG: DUF3854 domain-containing protein [Chroococcidiopsidaceae cyanobacterium CP_BM_RX_35]|nr:DUF3854 domain-containing protein [Chroococcidiopsidaceae cyanobacterium CP_BM_RX_35]